MKIYFKKNPNEIALYIKNLVGKCNINIKEKFIELTGFKRGYIYNYIPNIKALKNVKKIEFETYEIIPMVCHEKFYFRKPINTYEKFIIAGPCVISDFNEFEKTVIELKKLKVSIIRTPLFKPRTSPYSWEGFGKRGIKKLAEIKKRIKFVSVMEVLDPYDLPAVINVADIIQIGARNMRNYALLKHVASTGKPIILKRHPFSKIIDFLLSAEYLAKYGCKKIILCERGDSFSDGKSSINLNIIKEIKKIYKIPVIADVSHSAKERKKVIEYALKSWEISDGIMIEVTENPNSSPTDTKQVISLEEFKNLKEKLK